jgi:hypothetical protein
MTNEEKMNIRGITITRDTLSAWDKSFVPKNDLFFFYSLDEIRQLMPSNVLVVPREEFKNHKHYQQIDVINSYWLFQRN